MQTSRTNVNNPHAIDHAEIESASRQLELPISWGSMVLVCAGAAAWLYCALFILPDTPFIRTTWGYDEWVNLEGAMRMLQGQRIYLDFFQYTLPGTELMYLGTFKLWGVAAWIPNGVLLVVGVIWVWVGMVVARQVLTGRTAILPSLLMLPIFLAVPDATHHKLSNTLILCTMAVVTRERSRLRLGVAGALAGLATLFTQSTGVVAVVLIAVFVAWENRSRPRQIVQDEVSLLAPYAVVMGTAIAILLAYMGVERFYELIIQFPFKYYPADSRYNTWRTIWFQKMPTFETISDALLFPLYAIVYALPFAYVALALRYRRIGAASWNRLILVAVFGCVLLGGIWYSPDFGRLAESALPALVVTVWLSSQSHWRGLLNRAAWAMSTLLLIAAPALTQFGSYGTLDLPAGKVAFEDDSVCQTYQWLNANVQPGSQFFESGDMDDIYFLMHVRNPTVVPYITANDYTRPAQVQSAIAGLEQGQVKYVLWDTDLDHPVASDAPTDHLGPLRDYLHQHYRETTRFDCQFSGECVALERVDAPKQ